jgi:hypothetical protein
MRRTTLAALARCLILGAIVPLGGCWWFNTTTPPVDMSLPECPRYGEWSKRFIGNKDFTVSASGQLSLAGRLTDVPEFHDCQKFLDEATTGTPPYLTLFAIFARDSLKEKTARLDLVIDVAAPPPHDTAVAPDTVAAPIAVGEVYALDGAYGVLGIKPLFNCLFLYGTHSGLAARMVPVSGDEHKCLTITAPLSEPGKILQVRRTPFPDDTVPPVARWDWDGLHHRQHIGIACGTAWCDIGEQGFQPSTAHGASTGSPADRVVAIKGWYDEQRLAVPVSGGFGPGTSLKVGGMMATFVPSPGLGADNGPPDGSSYDGIWVDVATVGMTLASADYANKLNLEQSDVRPSTNKVSLCYGLRHTCIPDDAVKHPTCASGSAKQWWAKIVAQGRGETHTFCVTRREHPGIHIPGIVRWRWALHDETMWIRCLEGCCEVEAGSKDV